MFDLEKIKKLTGIKTVDFHARLSSTNDRAIEMVRHKRLNYPALVLTDEQTAGRGQRERRWWSGDGSLTFTWMIPLQDNPTASGISFSLIPATVGLAVAEALEQATELSDVQLKWPNDLIVAGRKIAGILIETVVAAEVQILIVGIGINVNNRGIPPQSIEKSENHRPASPTSVSMETDRTTSLNDLLIAIVQRLEIEFNLLQHQSTVIVERYNQRLFQRGALIRVSRPGGTDLHGVCDGISNDGGLILKTINGTEVIFSGTIQAV